MKLKGKKVIVRDLEEKDAKDFSRNGNSKEIHKLNWNVPYPFTVKKAEKFIKKSLSKKLKRENYEFGIEFEGKIIGNISLFSVSYDNKKANIGYWIGKDYRRRGLASEAVKEVIKFAFGKLGLGKISAKALTNNGVSNKFLEKMGFRKVGVLKKDQIVDGKRRDCYLWEMLR